MKTLAPDGILAAFLVLQGIIHTILLRCLADTVPPAAWHPSNPKQTFLQLIIIA